MSKVCSVCGKKAHVGGSITRRGLAKKKGGIGMHVVKNVKRTFSANLQRVRVRASASGGVAHVRVCAACIRSDKVVKA